MMKNTKSSTTRNEGLRGKGVVLRRLWYLGAILGITLLLVNVTAKDWVATVWEGRKIAAGFINNQGDQLKSDEGRTQILILGMNESGELGRDLTDTMIVVSWEIESGRTKLVSIPRDIWVEKLKAKINSAYHFGESESQGMGSEKAKQIVGEVIGQPIHYSVLVDFYGFIKLIDSLGGIEVDVVNTFDDYRYPIKGMETAEPVEKRYEHLHFEKGKQVMDGETALKFARSRTALGEEGNDFARSRRQKQIMLAVISKLRELSILENVASIVDIAKFGMEYVKTDMTQEELGAAARVGIKAIEKTPESFSIVGMLVNPPSIRYGGQYVLVPKSGKWEVIQAFIECEFEQKEGC